MRLDTAGGRLRVCNPNKTVREIFEISGFVDILSAFASRGEALTGICRLAAPGYRRRSRR